MKFHSKSLIFAFFGIGISLAVMSASKPKQDTPSRSDKILWQNYPVLKWSDFKGSPDALSSYKAMTFTNIEAKPAVFGTDTLEITLNAFFNKSKSWSKDKKSEKLLRHEQLHFDITELVVRMARKDCQKIKYNDNKTTYNKIKNTFSYYSNKVFDSINKCYDKETRHGIDTIAQQQWIEKIGKELNSFERWKNSSFSIVKKR